MTILPKGCKPDSFESYNSLKLSLTNICGLRLNFVECESFLESNSLDILALRFGNFSVASYFPLVRKDSITHMHCLAIYVMEGLSFTQDISLENSMDYYVFYCFYFTMSYFFFLSRSPSLPLCTVFDSILSNIDEVFSINSSTHLFLIGIHFMQG